MSVKETDFMNELDAATRLKPSTAAVGLLIAIMTLILFLMIWACIVDVEEITRGGGQVIPSREIQVVQSLEGGILQQILVREGEIVEKDQVLMRISDIQFSSEEKGTEARFLALEAKKARLKAEAEGIDFVLPAEVQEKAPQIAENEVALYNSRQKELQNAYDILDAQLAGAQADLAELQADQNRLAQSRNLLGEELRITKEMVAKRAAPKLEQIRLERQVSDIRGQINTNAQRKKGLEADMSTAQKERAGQEDKFRSQALSELNEVETQIAALQESLKSIGDRVYRTEVRSPVQGVVNNITIKTIGGVIEPAMRLVEIVPLDDEVKVVAKVAPHEIGFIKPDQPAKVKITAYDAQKFGSLTAKIVRIGAMSVSDGDGNVFFEIELQTDKNYMGSEERKLPVTPGMQAEVEIITGKRTIMEYMLKPFLRARDRVFTER